jgi:hypothetical protein
VLHHLLKVNPAWEAQIFTFYQSKLLIDEFGHTLPVEANVPVNGILPPIVNPAAIPIMFASAIPIWKNVLGGFF